MGTKVAYQYIASNKNISVGAQVVGSKRNILNEMQIAETKHSMADAVLDAQAQVKTPIGLGKIKASYPVADFVKTGTQKTLPLQYKASMDGKNYGAFVTGNSDDSKSIVVGGGVHGKYGAVNGSYVPSTKNYNVAASIPVTDHLTMNGMISQDGLGSIGATYVNGNLALNGNYTPKTDRAPDNYNRASVNYRF